MCVGCGHVRVCDMLEHTGLSFPREAGGKAIDAQGVGPWLREV